MILNVSPYILDKSKFNLKFFPLYIYRKYRAGIWSSKHSRLSTRCMGTKSQFLPWPAALSWTEHALRSAILDSRGLVSSKQKFLSLSSQNPSCNISLLYLTHICLNHEFRTKFLSGIWRTDAKRALFFLNYPKFSFTGFHYESLCFFIA